MSLRKSENLKKALAGNAILEYAVVGCCVVPVCIISIMGFSGDLKGYFEDLKQEMKSRSTKTVEQKAAVQESKVVQAQAQVAAFNETHTQLETTPLKVNASDPNALCASDWCISAPGLTGKSVSTAGSNGTKMVDLTQSSSKVFAQLATILNEKGADANTVTLLTQMANKGHYLGDMQSQFLNAPDYKAMDTGVGGMRTGLTEFKQMAKDLQGTMAQLPPESRGIVQDAANVIIGVGDSYTFTGGTGTGTSRVAYSYTSSKISLTHSNANTICTTAGNTTQCVK